MCHLEWAENFKTVCFNWFFAYLGSFLGGGSCWKWGSQFWLKSISNSIDLYCCSALLVSCAVQCWHFHLIFFFDLHKCTIVTLIYSKKKMAHCRVYLEVLTQTRVTLIFIKVIEGPTKVKIRKRKGTGSERLDFCRCTSVCPFVCVCVLKQRQIR